MSDALTPQEEVVMKATFKAAMLRAADIIDHITMSDVEDARWALYQEGVPLIQLSRIDRALVASCHLRSCAQLGGDSPDAERAQVIRAELKGKVQA